MLQKTMPGGAASQERGRDKRVTQSSSARAAAAVVLAAVIVGCAKAPPDAPVRALAPVDRVEVRVAESFPPQYYVGIVSREANSCVKFDSLDVQRAGSTVHVQVWNLVPSATSGLLCAQIVSTTEHNVALGTEFSQGETYTVLVNDVTETFVAQ